MASRKKKGLRRAGAAYLVGAGPGDPGLLTVRGRELLESADAIVYDALANPELLSIPRSGGGQAELHDVGKRGGEAETSARQTYINELLVRLVREGKKVVRLKGGDPFVFGRGGEEAQALAESGLAFEIVPGVTAGIAAPAFAGIPVTHRGLSTSVTLVTGHEDPMKGAPQVDWEALAKSGGTIVLYMGMKKLPAVAEAMIKGGMPGSIPAAAIQWGTHANQRTVVATLENIAVRAAEAGIGAPAITIVGWTVVLRDEIRWFDTRPLFGRRILVTRAGEAPGSSGLGPRLREQGADVVEIATTRIEPMSATALHKRLAEITDYSWIVFTSANAVTRFWEILEAGSRDTRAIGALKVGAVGPGTAASLRSRGVIADAVASTFAAEGLVQALAAHEDLAGAAVLWPCAEGARSTLQDGIAELGGTVDRVHIYRSVDDRAHAEALSEEVARGDLHLAVFTSASAVRSFANAIDVTMRGSVRAASIGPITSQALREAGIPIAVEARESTLDGLVNAILQAATDEEVVE